MTFQGWFKMCHRRPGQDCRHGLMSAGSPPHYNWIRRHCNRSRLDQLPTSDLSSEIKNTTCIRNPLEYVMSFSEKCVNGFDNNNELTINCGCENLSISYCSVVNFAVAESIAWMALIMSDRYVRRSQYIKYLICPVSACSNIRIFGGIRHHKVYWDIQDRA